MTDRSQGWDAVAAPFQRMRSGAGATTVGTWARRCLRPGALVLDAGCGSGIPISAALLAAGMRLHAVDAAPSMIAAFRRNFPGVETACEAVEDSCFFDLKYDAIVAVGLLFLFDDAAQARLIARFGDALAPGGRLLFTAPVDPCSWPDSLTGRTSLSLGRDGYSRLLRKAGLSLVETLEDEGGSHYFHALRSGRPASALPG
jgi:SAM-dependent methyltransferase